MQRGSGYWIIDTGYWVLDVERVSSIKNEWYMIAGFTNRMLAGVENKLSVEILRSAQNDKTMSIISN